MSWDRTIADFIEAVWASEQREIDELDLCGAVDLAAPPPPEPIEEAA